MFGLDGHFDYIVMHHLYGLAFFSLGALPRVIGDHPRDAAPSIDATGSKGDGRPQFTVAMAVHPAVDQKKIMPKTRA